MKTLDLKRSRVLFFFFLLLTLTPSVFADHQSDFLIKLKNYRTEVFGSRLKLILKHRFSLFDRCMASNEKESLLRNFQNIFKNDSASLTTTTEVEAALDLYDESQKLSDKNCLRILNQSERKLEDDEEKNFRRLGTLLKYGLCSSLSGNLNFSCAAETEMIFSTLSPHCISQPSLNFEGEQDKKACYAADKLLGHMVRSYDPTFDKQRDFLFLLEETIVESKPVNLWTLYQKTFPGLEKKAKENFLALLTTLYSAGNSKRGHVDGFGEIYWRETLKEAGDSSFALSQFHQFKENVDRFQRLVKWAEANKIILTIDGLDLTSKKNHDLMASFLGCYYKDRSFALRQILPILSGVGYESIDFISHLNRGESLNESLAHFKEDVHRYQTGSVWGTQFCNAR